MADQNTNSNRGPRPLGLGGAAPRNPPTGRPGDEIFRRSMAALSQRFGERDARLSAVDPKTAAEGRRAALRDYERTRRRRLNLALGAAVVAIAVADVGYMLLSSGAAPTAASPEATASTSPPPPTELAAAPPVKAPEPAPVESKPAVSDQSQQVASQAEPAPDAKPALPPAPLEAQPAPPPKPAQPAPPPKPAPPTPPTSVQAETVAPSSPAPSPAPTLASLRRDEVREVQSRLRSFGFNPGPVDGSAGPMTEAAVVRYQQDRAQAATGKVDQQLLDELRKDPAPQVQVAQRSARPAPYSSGSPSYGSPSYGSQSQPRYSGPLEAVRYAGTKITEFLQSLTR